MGAPSIVGVDWEAPGVLAPHNIVGGINCAVVVEVASQAGDGRLRQAVEFLIGISDDAEDFANPSDPLQPISRPFQVFERSLVVRLAATRPRNPAAASKSRRAFRFRDFGRA